MAVEVVGSVQLAWNTNGQATLTLPGGSAAGHLAIVEAALVWSYPWSSPLPSGWFYAERNTWWKVLSAADIATGTVLVQSSLTGMAVLSGAAGLGSASWGPTVRVNSASGGAFWRGCTEPYRTALAAATYRVGSVATSPINQHKEAIFFRAATAVGYYSLDGASADAQFFGWEVVPPAAPLAPTLLTPATGTQIDRSIPLPLSVAHQSASGLPQEKIRLVIRPAAGTWVSVKSDGTLHTDATTELTQSSGVVTIAANVLTNSTQYEWGAYTMDSSGWSPAATTRTLVARTPPTVAVTLTATAGDLSPVVSWVITPGTGSQTAYEARICAAADTTPDSPVAYTSGMMPGTYADWTPAPSTGYTNGGSYKGWVRVADSALTGAWTASTADTVSWTAPATPSGVTFQQGSPPTVTVAGIATGADSVEVQRSLNGIVWETIATVVPDATSEVIPVPRAGYGVSRWYRARITDVVDTISLPSEWRYAPLAASTDTGEYLVSETDCTDYLAVEVFEDGGRSLAQGVTTSYGLGATVARVDRSPTAGEVGQTTLLTWTLAARTALLAFIAAHDTFWLVWTPERTEAGAVYVPPTLMTITGEIKWDRLAQLDIAPRHVAFSWAEQ